MKNTHICLLATASTLALTQGAGAATVQLESDEPERRLEFEVGTKTLTGLDSVGLGRSLLCEGVDFRLLGEKPFHIDLIQRGGAWLGHEDSVEKKSLGLYGMVGARFAGESGGVQSWLDIGPLALYDATVRRTWGMEIQAGFRDYPIGRFLSEGGLDTTTFFDDVAARAYLATSFFRAQISSEWQISTGIAYEYCGYFSSAKSAEQYQNQHGIGPQFKLQGKGLEFLFRPMITVRPTSEGSYLYVDPEIEIKKSF